MKKSSIIFAVLGLALIAGCQSSDKNSGPAGSASKAGVQSWASGMRAMATGLEDLLPYVYSQVEFSDSKNRKDIVELLAEYQKSVDVVPQHIGEQMLGKDPLLTYSLERLKENSRQSLKAFQEGHSEYARSTLRESVNTCFNCHSANNMGPEFKFTTSSLSSSFRLSPTERADYYVATRQFEKAITALETVLNSPTSFYDSPHEQALALRKYLALEVRVKKDPVRAAKTVETFLNNKKLPYFMAADAQAWLGSLREWSKEGEAASADVSSTARRLLQKAESLQRTGGSQAGLVQHMRATSLLHESLRTAKSAQDRSKIYFSLGTSYDVLAELGVWDLPDIYFEACIKSWPKSTQAKLCYKSFERNVILGFSGSAGIFIPTEERQRLAALKELAGM